MVTAIGLIEFTSISRGIETTDVMLKAGGVELMFAKTACPGKFITLVYGQVGPVEASMKAGLEAAGGSVINHLLIPRVHPSLIPAINATSEITKAEALGVMEFFDMASAVIAADTAAKRSDISLIEVRLGMGIGGKSLVKLTGMVADVQVAVDAGLAEAGQRGVIVSHCVIPQPDPALFRVML